MSDRFVTLGTFQTFTDAELAVSRLQAAGIAASLVDEDTTLGWVKVLVCEADLTHAEASLAGPVHRQAVPWDEPPTATARSSAAEQPDVSTYYPPPPADVPAELSKPPAGYAREVVVLLVGLGLFLILYLALLGGSAWLAWWAARHDFGHILFNFGLGAFGAMLFLFFLKGLFKGRRDDRGRFVEVTAETQPELLAFVHRVCQEVRAPEPARVYLAPEANAMVLYDSTLINLVVPPAKHLVIGLGLVNVVTLREFKATLAHEFGHFSQRALGLGPYLDTANRVLWDVVYARDAWDEWVRRWSRTDPRLAFPAWGLRAAVWALRHLLGALYHGLNLIHLSIRRQMEFQADSVAVAAAGSDAIVHNLYRMGLADEALAVAGQDLRVAALHGRFTRNVFHHQSAAIDRLRRLRNNPRLGLPPDATADGPPVPVFEPNRQGDDAPARWRTHPTNREREANAKRHYLRAPRDDRSPWLLFRDPDAVRADVTRQFYRHTLNLAVPERLTDPAAVQAFLDTEHAETTYDPRYAGLYDDRPLRPGDLAALTGDARPAGSPAAFFGRWPDPSLGRPAHEFRRLRDEARLLEQVRWGIVPTPGKQFEFRGERRHVRDADALLADVDRDLAGVARALADLDRQVFLAHYQAARVLDERLADELVDRYGFHLGAQALLDSVAAGEATIGRMTGHLGRRTSLDMREFGQMVRTVRGVSERLAECLTAAEGLPAPALANVPAGTPLVELIWDAGAKVPGLPKHVYQFDPKWWTDFLDIQARVQERLRRVLAKSMGGILAVQERIARRSVRR